MKKKLIIVVTIVLLAIGFAAISTTLVINGNAYVSENTDDFTIIFTAATLDGINVYNDVIDDTKKVINFTTKNLKTLGDTSTLTYEVTNNSANYDAEVQVNCKVKDDTEAKYTSIKNELEGDVTVVKAKETLNGTLTVTLKKTATEEVKEEYVCELTFNAVERVVLGVAPINLYNMIKDNADTTTVIDYKIRSGVSGTNGIYTTTATVGNVPVYYYRGDADKVNNNIIFNNMCWKIIRTTETGGIKIIYNGTPTDGKCENPDNIPYVETIVWNSESGDAAYVGYMFGINNAGNSTTKEQAQTNTFSSTIKTYLEDTWFKNNMIEVEEYLEDTIFCNDRSTKAYDSATLGQSYGSTYGALGYGTNRTLYAAAHRASYDTLDPNPTLKCLEKNDKFTVNEENGNGKLKYPVGLISLDEVILAGFNTYASDNSDYQDTTNYLYTSSAFWTFSPVNMHAYGSARIGRVRGRGYIDSGDVNIASGVRPVISLKSEIFVDPTGDGTSANPYVVK